MILFQKINATCSPDFLLLPSWPSQGLLNGCTTSLKLGTRVYDVQNADSLKGKAFIVGGGWKSGEQFFTIVLEKFAKVGMKRISNFTLYSIMI